MKRLLAIFTIKSPFWAFSLIVTFNFIGSQKLFAWWAGKDPVVTLSFMVCLWEMKSRSDVVSNFKSQCMKNAKQLFWEKKKKEIHTGTFIHGLLVLSRVHTVRLIIVIYDCCLSDCQDMIPTISHVTAESLLSFISDGTAVKTR